MVITIKLLFCLFTSAIYPYRIAYVFFSFLLRERERGGGMNGRKPLVIAPAEPTFKDCLCILETCSILKSLLLPSFVDDTSI